MATYYRRNRPSTSRYFTEGRVYKIEGGLTLADDGKKSKPSTGYKVDGKPLWILVSEKEWNEQEGDMPICLDDPANREEAESLAHRLALVIVNDRDLHYRAKDYLGRVVEPSLTLRVVEEALKMNLGRDRGKYQYDCYPDKPFLAMLNYETAYQLGLDTDNLAKPDVQQTETIKETTMTTLNFNKAPENFTRVFGVEVTDLSDSELMDMIRKSKKHIESLSDLKDISRKVKQEIVDVEEGITILVKQLDKDC